MHETDLITSVEGVTHQLHLEPIADSKQPDHLLIIVKTGSSNLGVKITQDAARELWRRSRNSCKIKVASALN
jgi:hypothetical protein